jgi:hypothetical protein
MSVFHAFCSEWPYVFFFSVSQYTSEVIVVPCYMTSTITTPFLSRSTVSISFPTDNVRLDFTGLVGEVCASAALAAIWFQHSQMKPRFHQMLLLRCD